jgi:uncharacterized damage-inducible protein DinB
MTDMETLSIIVADSFSEHYAMLGKRVHELADSLSEEEVWKNPFSYGNSFGHLVLHITGNLNYYIGAQIAMTGYIRDRDREFTEVNYRQKAELLKKLDEAVEMVVATINKQSVDDWPREYTAKGAEDAGNRFNILVRCASHFYHHIGQMNYIIKEISRQKQ